MTVLPVRMPLQPTVNRGADVNAVCTRWHWSATESSPTHVHGPHLFLGLLSLAALDECTVVVGSWSVRADRAVFVSLP